MFHVSLFVNMITECQTREARRNVFTASSARYTLETKLYSTRSTVLNRQQISNKVERSTLSPIRSTLLPMCTGLYKPSPRRLESGTHWQQSRPYRQQS